MAVDFKYDHPNNTVRREHFIQGIFGGSGASATDFAPFRCRQKVLLKAVHYVVKSASSADERLYVVKNGSTTLGTITPATGGSAGSLPSTLPSRGTITITTNGTLSSLGELVTLRHDNTSGVYDIVWEYHVLYDSTAT